MTNFANQPPNPNGPSPRTEQQVICTRCNVPKGYMETRRLEQHMPTLGSGLLNDLFNFSLQPAFDLYVCPSCGSVEFFLDGVGEHMRPK